VLSLARPILFRFLRDRSPPPLTLGGKRGKDVEVDNKEEVEAPLAMATWSALLYVSTIWERVPPRLTAIAIEKLSHPSP